ncbi:MAG TPA: nuclear transport factor 2 family protein [Chitinophagaceae bacterium]|nr:nuclear transport factor 2 family protein [Chitinophagaceae bacterium]
MRTIFLMLFLMAACHGFAQSTEDSVKATVNRLFKAMNDADSAGVVNVFAQDAVIHSMGKTAVKGEKVEEFGSSIKKLKKGQLDERIEFGAVHIDANLASVWTPYRLYFDGKFIHCGADSFQLVRFGGEWKISYLIDTRRKDCD